MARGDSLTESTTIVYLIEGLDHYLFTVPLWALCLDFLGNSLPNSATFSRAISSPKFPARDSTAKVLSHGKSPQKRVALGRHDIASRCERLET